MAVWQYEDKRPYLQTLLIREGYWSSPSGTTPAATLNSALQREIATKGSDSRFVKTAPGRFAHKDSPVVGLTTATLAKKGKARTAATEPTSAEETEGVSTPTV